LIALDAVVKTSKRLIRAEDFFEVDVTKTTVLERDEIVTEIRVQAPPAETKSSFVKFASRKTIDFPIVNCAAMITTSGGKVSGARVCLNAVYVKPYRALKAEESIRGKGIEQTTAETAGDAAVFHANPLRHNRYMVQIAKTMVERAILACR
jgi:xanthine dehydrogenase YagS FAD-binding subunit